MTSGSFGALPPACPTDLTQYIPYPSVVFIFGIMFLIEVFFALLCFFRYNSVKLYNKAIKSSKISNNAWILYFIGLALR